MLMGPVILQDPYTHVYDEFNGKEEVRFSRIYTDLYSAKEVFIRLMQQKIKLV